MFKPFVPRFLGAMAYTLSLLVIGTVGYSIIEGWPIFEALYMTAITISAVGYEEVRPLTPAGRTFTMAMIFLGVTAIGVYLALLTSFLVEIDLHSTFERKKRMKRIAGLNQHIIVCGAGRTGSRLVTDLVQAEQQLIVIEVDPDRIEALQEDHPDVLCIEGDATHDQTLEEAGIGRASGLVSALSSDSDNVYVCLSVRALRPDLTIVARAYEDETIDKLYRAGASHVVSPNISGALRMSSMLLRPSVVSFLDVTTRSRDVSLWLEQATVQASSDLCGRSLQDAKIRENTGGLMVIAIRKNAAGEEFVFNPAADTRIEGNDELIVLGQPEQIERLRQYTGDSA